MKRGFLIYNPGAGQAQKSETEVSEVVQEFEKYDINITPSPTFPDVSILDMVKDLVQQSPDVLVGWGGDGTIHEVVNGMYGADIPVGLIPGGTANLLARELNIGHDIKEAVRIIGEGKTTQISLGRANKKLFLLMVGIGFDSAVIRNVDLHLKRKVGYLAFGLAAIRTAIDYKYPKITIKVNGSEKECVFAVICNAREYAAFFRLAPDADISDEYLYIVLFKDAGLGSLIRYGIYAWQSRHLELKSVESLRASRIEANGSEEVWVQADGELIGYLPMKFEIIPRALKVFCP
ncbi:diacylglycerol kinase family lipid kinase [bacterium]|nr:diacylglycerol kinase family lipid kinase [bacterium]